LKRDKQIKKKNLQNSKLKHIRTMKKRNITLMNFLYQTESYTLTENNHK
jgi:hypothetical protein